MVDLSLFQGTGQFGKAYQFMLEHDTHAEGSVDRLLMTRMIRLCPETASYLYSEYTPTSVRYPGGLRPELEKRAVALVGDAASDESRLERLVGYTARLSTSVEEEDLDGMRFGGTEEAIIRRGSDWCTDVARVACALCQVAGLPARMVMLFNTAQAYSGHTIIEAYRNGRWGAVDSSIALCYRDREGRPLPAWALMRRPDLVERHRQIHPDAYYTEPGLFRGVALSNYFFWAWPADAYGETGINAYYRTILERSNQGWPGGLRWIHGEDRRL
jgi:transglutaminase-like putative cysteine protease